MSGWCENNIRVYKLHALLWSFFLFSFFVSQGKSKAVGIEKVGSSVFAIVVKPEVMTLPHWFCVAVCLGVEKGPAPNTCSIFLFLLNVSLKRGFEQIFVCRQSGNESFWLSVRWGPIKMRLRGIKDSFEGGWERLHTVLTSIQIPFKSLYITLIKPCAVRYTNSHWSYHRATMYHGCLLEVQLIPQYFQRLHRQLWQSLCAPLLQARLPENAKLKSQEDLEKKNLMSARPHNRNLFCGTKNALSSSSTWNLAGSWMYRTTVYPLFSGFLIQNLLNNESHTYW